MTCMMRAYAYVKLQAHGAYLPYAWDAHSRHNLCLLCVCVREREIEIGEGGHSCVRYGQKAWCQAHARLDRRTRCVSALNPPNECGRLISALCSSLCAYIQHTYTQHTDRATSRRAQRNCLSAPRHVPGRRGILGFLYRHLGAFFRAPGI